MDNRSADAESGRGSKKIDDSAASLNHDLAGCTCPVIVAHKYDPAACCLQGAAVKIEDGIGIDALERLTAPDPQGAAGEVVSGYPTAIADKNGAATE